MRAKRVYIGGNGGSAANAMHMANDLFSCGIRAHALAADISIFSMIGNDFGYENVFSRQLAVYGEKGDLFIALSGSGNSPNIINALLEAEKIGMDTFAIIGNFETLGKAAQLAKNVIKYGRGMQSAEAQQIIIGHEAMKCLLNPS